MAKINTEGTRVIDVSYVGQLDGQKVATAADMARVSLGLLSVLDARTALALAR